MDADEVLAWYTDEALAADMAQDMDRGRRNSAPYLLKLDTPERRLRAVWEGRTLTNILGGIGSANTADAVFALLGNIARGEEEKELYGEEFARKELEHQRARREQREAHDRIAFENYQRRMANQ